MTMRSATCACTRCGCSVTINWDDETVKNPPRFCGVCVSQTC